MEVTDLEQKEEIRVDKLLVTQAIEFVDCTEKARQSIKAVKIWQM